MRKKLDTRFPAARIKKIMQADEEVGKIAMATPVLISKALELFLQDLCDRTYEITLRRGAKTMNSHHLKECVRSHSVFDFLRETVSRVPDIEAESAGGDSGRRRKAVEAENDDSCDEDVKRPRLDSLAVPSRGRGRGRGRGRKSNSERARIAELDKPEDNEAASSPQLSEDGETSSKSPADDANIHEGETSGAVKEPLASTRCPKDFDLNMELDENGEVAAGGKDDEDNTQWLGAGFQGFSSDVVSMKMHQDQNVFQPEEDYDCEDEE
eukprot:c16188_g1_i2 orf=387-1190(-)